MQKNNWTVAAFALNGAIITIWIWFLSVDISLEPLLSNMALVKVVRSYAILLTMFLFWFEIFLIGVVVLNGLKGKKNFLRVLAVFFLMPGFLGFFASSFSQSYYADLADTRVEEIRSGKRRAMWVFPSWVEKGSEPLAISNFYNKSVALYRIGRMSLGSIYYYSYERNGEPSFLVFFDGQKTEVEIFDRFAMQKALTNSLNALEGASK